MEEEQRQQIKKYISLLLRKKELLIIYLMIGAIAGIGVYLKTTKEYKSTALIMYQQQSLNPSRVSRDAKLRTEEMVISLATQVTSRSNLEAIIKQHKLYAGALEKLPMEDVVMAMRKNIDIIPPRKGNTFHVSFTGSNPRKVMLVTNALAARFIEENLRFRYEKASENSAYIKDELEMSKVTLDKKEKLMRDYKLKHYNEMPQQLDFNVVRLNFLQTQLQNGDQGGRELEQTRLLIQEQISNLNAIIQPQLPFTPDNTVGQAKADLNRIKTNLNELRLKYTDNHPEIKKFKKLLEIQQQKYNDIVNQNNKKESRLPEQQLTTHNIYPNSPPTVNEKQLQQLTMQLKEVSFNITNLKENRKNILSEIEKYSKWINATPVREAEWTSLTRDYEQLNNHYQQLVSQNLNAEGAEALERRQKGSQFKIVDSAHFPEKPYKPNFRKIMLAALAIGAGLGGGLTIALDILDTSFKDAMDIETHLQIPVLCSIPTILLDKERKIAKLKSIAWGIAGTITTLTIISGMVYLWRKGLIIL